MKRVACALLMLALLHTAVAWARPPSPADKADAFIAKYEKLFPGKLVNNAQLRKHIAGIFHNIAINAVASGNRTQEGERAFNAMLTGAYSNELRNIVETLREPHVRHIMAPDPTNVAGEGRPDLVVESLGPTGETILAGREVATSTGRPGGKKKNTRRGYSLSVQEAEERAAERGLTLAEMLSEIQETSPDAKEVKIGGVPTMITVPPERRQSSFGRKNAVFKDKVGGNQFDGGYEVAGPNGPLLVPKGGPFVPYDPAREAKDEARPGGSFVHYLRGDPAHDAKDAARMMSRNAVLLRKSPVHEVIFGFKDRSQLRYVRNPHTGEFDQGGAVPASVRHLVIVPVAASQIDGYYKPGGVDEQLQLLKNAIRKSEIAADQGPRTAVVPVVFDDGAGGAASPAVTGLGDVVGDMLTAADRDGERAAGSLSAGVQKIVDANAGPRASAILFATGGAGPVVGPMLAKMRERDATRGAALDAVVAATESLGVLAASEMAYTGSVVVMPQGTGAPPTAPSPGASPSSAAFNDTGQVVVANAGPAADARQVASVVAAVASVVAAAADKPGKAVSAADVRRASAAGGASTPAPDAPPAAFAPAGGRSTGSAVAAPRNAASADLGGIDFSSLELRYLADASSQGRRATAFAFKAVPGGSGSDRNASLARRAIRESSDAFFVWLALPKQSFTVNLNPGEPNRIIDRDLGRTDAGRILLEADLRMKKTVAPLIHPRSRLGARFWDALGGVFASQSARLCLAFRQWIVPAPATVSESRGELHILKAPLYVKMESDYRRRAGVPGVRSCPGQPQDVERRSEAVYRRLILPHVQRAVRRSPQYAALRRVYLSRVGAEWYRRLGSREGGAFGEIIDSGNISRWVSKRRWRPRDVFNRYVRSLRRGEFRVQRRMRRGNLVSTSTLVYGGVDFTEVPQQAISPTELRSRRPELAGTLVRALSRPAVERDRGDVWLAGASFERTYAAADPGSNGGSRGDAPMIAAAALLLALIAGIGLAVRRMRT